VDFEQARDELITASRGVPELFCRLALRRGFGLGSGRRTVGRYGVWTTASSKLNQGLPNAIAASSMFQNPELADSRPVLSLLQPLIKLEADLGRCIRWSRHRALAHVAPLRSIRGAKLAAGLIFLSG
jgi:hypothetical protein